MKYALVTGAGGFVAHHLIRKLKSKGYWVRGVDLKQPEFSKTYADDFEILDLRQLENCQKSLLAPTKFDEVYHLAADMGGMGFIHSANCEIMRNNSLINNHMLHTSMENDIKRYFFSSSVCVYRNMKIGEPELTEEQAYPAMPDNDYGWEKLYAERMALAYGVRYGIEMRIARFQNCYGPEGTWHGGREKAPVAICRKVAEASKETGEIEIWGDGTAVRSYIYIDDLIEGIYKLMQSDQQYPVNIGTSEYVSVNQLAAIISEVAYKKIKIRHINGPIGVESRNFSHEKMNLLGWRPKYSLKEGLAKTYPWVADQIKKCEQSKKV